MKIERMTVCQLIEQLQHYAGGLPVVVESYEEGYDPVTDFTELTVTEKQKRYWYVGVYEKSDEQGEKVLLISSKYSRTEIETTNTLPADDESDPTP